MKKFLLSASFAVLATGAFAQLTAPNPEIIRSVPTPNYGTAKSIPDGQQTRDYDRILNFLTQGDSLAFIVIDQSLSGFSYIMPDSLAQINYRLQGSDSGILQHIGIHSVGQVLDPKSYIFDGEFSRYTRYKLDKVVFPYAYIRVDEDVVDTLVVQFYQSPNVRTYVWTGVTEGDKVTAFPDFNPKTSLGSGAIKTIRYELSQEDTAVALYRFQEFTAGLNVPANGICAFTVTFKPGYKVNLGDTLADFSTGESVYKRNVFGMPFYGVYEDIYIDSAYNHALQANNQSMYNAPNNNWFGRYIPGDAWNNATGDFTRHLNADFYVSSTNVGIEEKKDNGYVLNPAFPNPSNGVVNFKFTMPNGSDATLELYNTLGQKVRTIASGQFNAGETKLTADFSDLQSGMYYYTLTANGTRLSNSLNLLK